jgi:Bacterial pre-peptidase C-terminal domain
MVRECWLPLCVVVMSTGCSLILDFSDSQIPIDAPPDAPYTQEQCMYKEPNDTVETATMIEPSDVGPAAICATDPEDVDFYKFNVPAGTASVQIKITFLTSPKGDLDLKLLDTTGTMLSQSRGFLDFETITCPAMSPACAALAPGDYVFEVLPGSAMSTNPYNIALTITP